MGPLAPAPSTRISRAPRQSRDVLLVSVAGERLGSAKTGLVLKRRQRAPRQTGPRLAFVVCPRRNVVRRIRVEEGRQVLDLPTPRPQLEHPAAVQPDLVRLAVGVEVEQLAEKAEARRLDVQGERREGEALDVVDGVNR